MVDQLIADTLPQKSRTVKKEYVVLFVLGIFLAVIIVVVKLMFVPYPGYIDKWPLGATAIITELQRLLGRWDVSATWYEALFVFISVAAIVASIYVAAFANDEKHKNSVKVSAFFAALFFALLTSFNLGKKSGDIRNAYRHLKVALMKYEAGNQSPNDLNDLINAYSDAETEIGNVEFNYTDFKQGKKDIPDSH